MPRSMVLLLLFTAFWFLPCQVALAESEVSFTDVVPEAIFAEQIYSLATLGIVTGYPDGSFRPENTLTRAEFAVILCRATGLEAQAQSMVMRQTAYYTDVSAEYWASGYINAASELGILHGFGNGQFAPEQTVTGEQVLKALFAAWGYQEEAEALGGYPRGYLLLAEQYMIGARANYSPAGVADRELTCVLIYDFLNLQHYEDKEHLKPEPEQSHIPFVPFPAYPDDGSYYDPVPSLLQTRNETLAVEHFTTEQKLPTIEFLPLMIYEGSVYLNRAVLAPGAEASFFVYQDDSPGLLYESFVDHVGILLESLPQAALKFELYLDYGKVGDAYYGSLVWQDGKYVFVGPVLRHTILRIQHHVNEVRFGVELSNAQQFAAFPFKITAVELDNDSYALRCEYLEVVAPNEYVAYSINDLDINYSNNDRVFGTGKEVSPLWVSELELDIVYFFDLAISHNKGSSISIRGEVVLRKNEDGVDFFFKGDFIDFTVHQTI